MNPLSPLLPHHPSTPAARPARLSPSLSSFPSAPPATYRPSTVRAFLPSLALAMRAESSAENTSCSLSRPRDREVPCLPFSLILFLSPSPSTSLLSTLLLLPSLLISPFYNVALSLLSMPVKYTFYHSRSLARLFSFLRHLFLSLSLSTLPLSSSCVPTVTPAAH